MNRYIENLIAFITGALMVGFFWLGYYSYQHCAPKQAAWTPRQEKLAELFNLTPADVALPVILWEEK